MDKKKIVFITGTRADYGKLKPLMKVLNNSSKFEIYIFVCGMHLLEKFGSTYNEVLKDGYKNTYIAYGLCPSSNTSINLGNIISYFSGYVENIKPDMVIVHGDRIEALAGAIVSALHNIVVAHIEGGEVSGTIDESIRHAITKFSHIHFVCNEESKKRLLQLGENKKYIFVIGSPDIDIMLEKNLPALSNVKEYYGINYENYGILMYHPVTTENKDLKKHVRELVDAVIESKKNYIVVYPNNDLGYEIILNEYDRFQNNNNFKVFPSIRFEYFLTLLRNADFIIGNSSAGIRESGVYGIPAIDVGTRQSGRYNIEVSKNIQHVFENKDDILRAVKKIDSYRINNSVFGSGDSKNKFFNIIDNLEFNKIELQKRFIDYNW